MYLVSHNTCLLENISIFFQLRLFVNILLNNKFMTMSNMINTISLLLIVTTVQMLNALSYLTLQI